MESFKGFLKPESSLFSSYSRFTEEANQRKIPLKMIWFRVFALPFLNHVLHDSFNYLLQGNGKKVLISKDEKDRLNGSSCKGALISNA